MKFAARSTDWQEARRRKSNAYWKQLTTNDPPLTISVIRRALRLHCTIDRHKYTHTFGGDLFKSKSYNIIITANHSKCVQATKIIAIKQKGKKLLRVSNNKN